MTLPRTLPDTTAVASLGALLPEAVKNSPGEGTGPPTALTTPCESLEAACPHAVFSPNFEFLHSFPRWGEGSRRLWSLWEDEQRPPYSSQSSIAAAADTRIDVALLSGYFGSRQEVWSEPIYRNVWGLLEEFGDAELATLIAPRDLLVEFSQEPLVTGHKGDLKVRAVQNLSQEFLRIGHRSAIQFHVHH